MARHAIRDSSGKIIKYVNDKEYEEIQNNNFEGFWMLFNFVVLISLSIYAIHQVSGDIDTPIEKIILIILGVISLVLSYVLRNITFIFFLVCLGVYILFAIGRWIFA